jgi:maltooligosyltrehalose trehalohydrolase
MLFMGEEWGSSQPFPFFCDFDGELGEKIRNGRRKEFASFPEFKDPQQRDRIPDPLAKATFLSAKLDWRQSGEEVHAEWLEWYKRILLARKEFIVPSLDRIGPYAGRYRILGAGAVMISWTIDEARVLVLAANLSDNSTDGFTGMDGTVLWQEGPEPTGNTMRPWSSRWSIQTEAWQRDRLPPSQGNGIQKSE